MPNDTVVNPFTGEVAESQRPNHGLVSVEQQRAVAEVQARMIIARANPRDPIRSMDMILQDCTRPTLASGAVYQYARGGSDVSGPSIRLAETMARRWGNIASGIKEISRRDGYSDCVAYAWDLETGFYDERQFQVRHWRDTKRGGHALTDERDIYELVANMGQRRKRAVLLSVIPGDVIEAAVEQCERTLKTTIDVSAEGIKKLADAFAAIGVSKEQIEARCQCRLQAIRPAQIVQLRKIYASIKDGMSVAEDWFGGANTATVVAEQLDEFASSPPSQPHRPHPVVDRPAEQAMTAPLTIPSPAATDTETPATGDDQKSTSTSIDRKDKFGEDGHSSPASPSRVPVIAIVKPLGGKVDPEATHQKLATAVWELKTTADCAEFRRLNRPTIAVLPNDLREAFELVIAARETELAEAETAHG